MPEANPAEGATTQESSLDTAASAFGRLLAPEAHEPIGETAPTQAETSQDEKEGNQVQGEVDSSEDKQEGSQDSTEQVQEESESKDASDDLEASEDTTEPQFETLSQLAEALDLTEDEFLQRFKVKTVNNGVETEVNLSDLRNGYQMEADYRKKTAELSDQRKAFEEQRQQQEQALNQQIQNTGIVLQQLQEQLEGDYNAVNWQQLREEDPAEFAARRQELIEKQQSLHHAQNQIRAQIEQQQQEINERNQQQFEEYLKQERDALIQAFPKWQDKSVYEADSKAIDSVLGEYGFTPQEIANIYDHRYVRVAHDLMELRKLKTKVDPKLKQVKQLPKFVKPGAATKPQERKQAAFKDAKKQLRKTGSIKDAAAAWSFTL